MKQIQLFITLVIGQLLFSAPIKAADIPDSTTVSKQHYYAAKEQFKDMLSGKEELSYEKAITIVENAYYENQVNLVDFNLLIDFHVQNINRIIEINYDESAMKIERILHKTEEQQKEEYRNALINWAIYSYITDTTLFLVNNQLFYHLPYEYSYEDPLGTVNWQTTQVFNLLDNKTGNCYALASLFKIFSERLNSEAFICTAPGHIYIRHADHKGIYYNVELGSKAFPGTGSLETLTYTTDEATKNGISLRELDLKQSVALNLVYLAKGYAYKFGVKDDNFIMECAELALQYDELNLNAMLLKAEVLEERLIKKDKTVKALQSDKTFQEYEKLITHLFDLGYREMPTEMKDLVISRLRKEDSPYPMTNHTPKPFEDLGVKEERYATLSNGLFDEQMLTKLVEQYHRTMFGTKQKKITELVELDTTYNNYPMDLVVFAWQIDPKFKMYPGISPYAAFGNNPLFFIDPSGEVLVVAGDAKARETARVALQKLTNNKVIIDAEGVVSVISGNENPSKNLVNGTALIQALVDNKKTATINLTTGKNTTEPLKNGDAIINFNPNLTEGGLDEEGNSYRPAEIGLAHEGFHALINMTGIGKNDDDNLIFIDPDNNYQESATMDVEEYNARVLENAIRQEQGLSLRLLPKIIDASGSEGIEIEPNNSNGTITIPEQKSIKFDKGDVTPKN
ncbi:MAG: hypothetical protein VR77_03830 [Flavobacteriales bacterium BRH_c54]|nr:MAG: hypothetical protein VR77_03830 [Flavobacteriales bacterium BRH_c54]